MIPACLTTVLWSFSVVAARRSIEQLGENAANFWRLLLALAVVGAMTHAFGGGFTASAFVFFFLSGVVGFGFGDIGGFYAIPRIGSRLTILMAQCLAAPIAGVAEWIWLGTLLDWREVLAVSVILVGVVVALLPGRGEIPAESVPRFIAGVLFGLLAAMGQGIGAVLSRKAYAVAESTGEIIMADAGVIDSILVGSAAGYQRLIGGIIVVVLFWSSTYYYRAWRSAPTLNGARASRAAKIKWVTLNAMAGPIAGTIFYQWALATTPSAIVQPIVALTPVVIIPFTYWLEGERPRIRSVIGGIVGVAGVILLATA